MAVSTTDGSFTFSVAPGRYAFTATSASHTAAYLGVAEQTANGKVEQNVAGKPRVPRDQATAQRTRGGIQFRHVACSPRISTPSILRTPSARANKPRGFSTDDKTVDVGRMNPSERQQTLREWMAAGANSFAHHLGQIADSARRCDRSMACVCSTCARKRYA